MAKKTKKESPVVEATAGEIATKVEETKGEINATDQDELNEKPADETVPEKDELNEKPADETVPEKDELNEKADMLFKSYPSAAAFHFTSDGIAFLEKTNAENHGRTLLLKAVKTINRKEA
ncbi:MAG: hypothetical protein RBR40_08315 [Tenuifilaceae bacterium]|nr:hypothetical protein [Tenuifilaceae bacterium]